MSPQYYLKLIITTAFCVVPFVSMGAELYYPKDTAQIYVIDEGDSTYSLSIHLKTGQRFSFHEVEYENSRYQFYEDIADEINDHRKFTGFDDDDVVGLVHGGMPFVYGDIRSVRAVFTEDLLDLTVQYMSGEKSNWQAEITDKFTAPDEAAEVIRSLITSQPSFVGSLSIANVYELAPTFEGVEYYAPDVSRIEATYDTDTEKINVQVYFVNGEEREFETILKPTKQQVAEDIALLITEFYTDREGGVLLRSDISSKIAWIDIPRTANDIEIIIVSQKDDEHIWIEVRTILNSGTRAYTLFQSPFEGTLDESEALAIIVSDLLEENPAFAPDFDINDIASRVETGDINFTRYGIDSESDTQTVETSEEEDTEQETTSTESDEEEESTEEVTDSEEAEAVVQGSTVSDTDTLYQSLLALIVLYIQQNNLDIDISGLQ